MNVKEPPSGMSIDELITRKRKLKRYAWMQFILFFLFSSLTMEYFGYLGGWYVTLKAKTLPDLRVANGIFYAEESSGRIHSFQVGLKDDNSGNVILKANEGLCGGYEPIKKYAGRKATIWYYREPGYDVNWMYQLEVEGQVVCDVTAANKKVERRNQDKSWLWFRLGWPLGTGVIVGLYCYLVYRRRITELYGEGERI